MRLNDDPHFLNSQSVKTYKGAEGRLERASHFMDKETWERLVTFIMIKPDGSYMPVAILNDNNMWLMCHLASIGVYCKNA